MHILKSISLLHGLLTFVGVLVFQQPCANFNTDSVPFFPAAAELPTIFFEKKRPMVQTATSSTTAFLTFAVVGRQIDAKNVGGTAYL